MNRSTPTTKFTRPALWIGILLALVFVLSACAPAATPTPAPTAAPTATSAPQPTTPPQPTATSAPKPTTPPEATINVATDPKLGKILVDGKGMTLYMYTKDEANKVNCADACLKNWQPLVTQGSPVLGDGVDKALVGTAALPDGSKIVTYNKMPLYYWVKDTKPGDTTGQDVGKVWYVVSPAGKIIGQEPTLAVATDPKLGKILVDGKGMTLYMYTKDEANKVNCAEACLKAWPPFVTLGNPVLGEGIDKSLIGTAALADGSKIVTYNKMPLYYYAKDTKAGDTTGQDVGKVWYVVAPDGKVIGK